jgi:FAD/FMN-containing dehydrogenase
MTHSSTVTVLNQVGDLFDGRLLLPGEDGYNEARLVGNGMVDRTPRVIVRCASTRDVVIAARTALDLGPEIGVRCGGHASGAYGNVLSGEGADGVRCAYPPGKLARLTAVKDTYDPHNVFHLNHNIQPSQG